jgi:hypothetical protein
MSFEAAMYLNQSASTASQLSSRRTRDLLQHLAEFMSGESNAHCFVDE